MQYSLPEVDRLMSRSQSIRDAIKGPDHWSFSLSGSPFYSFPKLPFPLKPYLPSLTLSNIVPPSLHLSHSPQISVNDDISHGSKQPLSLIHLAARR